MLGVLSKCHAAVLHAQGSTMMDLGRSTSRPQATRGFNVYKLKQDKSVAKQNWTFNHICAHEAQAPEFDSVELQVFDLAAVRTCTAESAALEIFHLESP